VDKPGKGPSKREVEMAGKLVESLHREFDPDDYEDTYREAVLDLIKRKAKGENLTPEEPEPEEEPADLTAALQASLGS
jgi:DNA end-binding protein Ku